MSQAVLFATGMLLVLIVVLDVLHTTIHVNGSGLISRRFSLLMWRAVPRRSGALTVAGPVILVATVALWFLLFWLGWCLMFMAGSDSVVSDPDKTPADLASLIYFVGFSIITLGVGDYAPGGPLWQMLTVLASASGFFIVTLVITYVLPLVSAVVEQRQLAAYIHSLGNSPEQILARGWNGEDFSALNAHLTSLAPMLHRQTHLHTAYPILHYFRNDSRKASIAPAVALLDELLTVLEWGVPQQQRISEATVVPLRGAISELLATLQRAYIHAADQPPPLPHYRAEPSSDESAKLPEVPEDSAELQHRRCLLLGWLKDQGWQWRGEPAANNNLEVGSS